VIYWLGIAAVATMAAAGVLEAGRKRFDLFGMVFVALVAALGGGTLRDMMLNRPVFWVADQTYLLAALAAAFTTFFLARALVLPLGLFLIPDAVGLALFTVTGTKAAVGWGAPWLVASFLGVITGVVGGILRDVLCNEEPLVFRGHLYATAAWGGALLFLAAPYLGFGPEASALLAGSVILLVRLLAIRFDLTLPRFEAKGE
jgi:uncharacterized membrane protein YeiH